MAIQRAGGFPVLVALLGSGPSSELTEYSVAVLGNLAAGGHALKDAIRDVRARPPPCLLSRRRAGLASPPHTVPRTPGSSAPCRAGRAERGVCKPFLVEHWRAPA